MLKDVGSKADAPESVEDFSLTVKKWDCCQTQETSGSLAEHQAHPAGFTWTRRAWPPENSLFSKNRRTMTGARAEVHSRT